MSGRSQSISAAIHIAFLALLLLWSVHPSLPDLPRKDTPLLEPAPLHWRTHQAGGGQRSPEPVRKGVIPLRVTRAFTPPIVPVNYHPKLAVPVAIEAPPDVSVAAGAIGDPNGIGKWGGGRGGPAGIGDGEGPAIGSGRGNDGVYSVGHGTTAPVPVHRVEPEYSELARRAKISGSVTVYAEIGPDGKPHNLRVLRGLGLDLDEKALDAVSKWLFKPGMRDGWPVTVRATFEVNFRLL